MGSKCFCKFVYFCAPVPLGVSWRTLEYLNIHLFNILIDPDFITFCQTTIIKIAIRIFVVTRKLWVCGNIDKPVTWKCVYCMLEHCGSPIFVSAGLMSQDLEQQNIGFYWKWYVGSVICWYKNRHFKIFSECEWYVKIKSFIWDSGDHTLLLILRRGSLWVCALWRYVNVIIQPKFTWSIKIVLNALYIGGFATQVERKRIAFQK